MRSSETPSRLAKFPCAFFAPLLALPPDLPCKFSASVGRRALPFVGRAVTRDGCLPDRRERRSALLLPDGVLAVGLVVVFVGFFVAATLLALLAEALPIL
ncbi:hypothetical protein ACQKPX_10305 [Photobacterium sp. DNB23_23_1]